MKTRVITFLAALLASILVSAQSKNCNFDVQLTSNNQITVRHTNANGQKIKVLVFNENESRVSSKSFVCKGNMKATYDLKRQDEGTFTFKVICNNQVVLVEKVSKLADGSLSIPTEIKRTNLNPKHNTNPLFTNK